MTTSVETNITQQVNAIFHKPCVSKTCKEAATYAFHVRHAKGGCDLNGYICKVHLDVSVQQWAEFLNEGTDERCAQCGHRYAGQVSDYFKYIRL